MRILPTLAVLTFVSGVAMLGVGYFYGGSSRPAPPRNVVYFTPTPTPVASETPTDVPSPTPTPPPYNGAVARFEIPRFNVNAAVEALALKSGTNELDVPHNPRDVGWYDSSLDPGGPFLGDKPGFGGNAVFAAHVDYYGLNPNLMPFHELNQLNPGDQIVVVMDNGTQYTYEVILKQTYDVSSIKMGELIDAPTKPKDKEWITLITCDNAGPYVPVYPNQPNGPVEYLNRDVVVAQRVP